jgi:hypothetical protein
MYKLVGWIINRIRKQATKLMLIRYSTINNRMNMFTLIVLSEKLNNLPFWKYEFSPERRCHGSVKMTVHGLPLLDLSFDLPVCRRRIICLEMVIQDIKVVCNGLVNHSSQNHTHRSLTFTPYSPPIFWLLPGEDYHWRLIYIYIRFHF